MASIWINGVPVGGGDDFRYVHVQCPQMQPPYGVCPTPVCVTVSDPVSLGLGATGNVIAVRVKNYTGHEMFASWLLDITCTSGLHTYVKCGVDRTIVYHQQESGAFPACTGSAPPGTGGSWYDKAFVPAGWSVPAVFTGLTFTKPVTDPVTGLALDFMAATTDANSETQCDALYFRQTFDLGQ